MCCLAFPWLACFSLESSPQAGGYQQSLSRQRQYHSHACAVSLLSVLNSAEILCAEEVRARLLRQTNNPQLVQRLAPMQPGEAQAAQRARSLYSSLMRSMGQETQPLLQVVDHGCIQRALTALVTQGSWLQCPCYDALHVSI